MKKKWQHKENLSTLQTRTPSFACPELCGDLSTYRERVDMEKLREHNKNVSTLQWLEFQGSGSRVQGSGCRVQDAGDQESGVRVQGSALRVQSSRFRVQGSGFRVQSQRIITCKAAGVDRRVSSADSPNFAKITLSPLESGSGVWMVGNMWFKRKGFGVWGLGFGVWGLGFGVLGFVFGVSILRFGVSGFEFVVLVLRDLGFGFGVWVLGVRDSGVEVTRPKRCGPGSQCPGLRFRIQVEGSGCRV